MKKKIHPKDYRFVAFKDMSSGHTFITRSTVKAKEKIEIEGKEYPLVKLEISNKSHPFYTGKRKLLDSGGRVDRFRNRYKKHFENKEKASKEQEESKKETTKDKKDTSKK